MNTPKGWPERVSAEVERIGYRASYSDGTVTAWVTWHGEIAFKWLRPTTHEIINVKDWELWTRERLLAEAA